MPTHHSGHGVAAWVILILLIQPGARAGEEDAYENDRPHLPGQMLVLENSLAMEVDYDIVTAVDESGSMRLDPRTVRRHLAALREVVLAPPLTVQLTSSGRKASRLEFFAFAGDTAILSDPVAVTPTGNGPRILALQLDYQSRNGIVPPLRTKNSTDMVLAVAHGLSLLLAPDRGHAHYQVLNIITDVDPSRIGTVAQLAHLRRYAESCGVTINVLHIGHSDAMERDYFERIIATGFVVQAEDYPTLEAAYTAKFALDIAGLDLSPR